jgi:WD40-like Beta Propeller Repeat
MTAQNIPSASQPVKRAQGSSGRDAVRLGIAIGVPGLVLGSLAFLYTDGTALLLFTLGYWFVAALLPGVIAVVAAISAARNVRSLEPEPSTQTDMAGYRIAHGYFMDTLYRFRLALAVLGGLMPGVLIAMLNVAVQTDVVILRISVCYPGEPCSRLIPIPSMADTTHTSLLMAAALVGMWGLNILGASVGLCLGLWWKRSGIAAAGALVGMGAVIVLIGVVSFSINSEDSWRTNLLMLTFAVSPYILSVLLVLLAGTYIPKGETQPMRKRKTDESTITTNRMLWSMSLGIVVLLALSGGTLWWFAIRPTPIPYNSQYYYPTRIPYNPTSYVTTPAAKVPTSVPSMRTEDARFVLATVSGDILTNADGTGTRPTGLHGKDVAVAPDGRTLAYVRDNGLILYRSGKEQPVGGLSGSIRMPAWSADGNVLAFVVREATADVVYRLTVDTLKASALIRVPDIAAPPLSNPATGRLLIVERLDTKVSAFYTIDPNCATDSACKASRKDIATVSRSVSWASYHPSATGIAFSDRDDGNIYMLNTANGDITPLMTGNDYKRRPVFSRDGAWLAYVTDSNQLYALRLADSTSQIVALANIASADWSR